MLEQLFGSKTRLKILRLFFRDPSKAFFVRELSRQAGAQVNAIRRELELLLQLGVIAEKKSDKKADPAKAGSSLRKYYQLNPDAIIFSELQALLIKDKLIGQQEFIRDLEKKTGKVKLLVLTGEFTGDKRAETDLLLVGKIKPRTLTKLVEQYEKDLGFSIRYTVMTEAEFADRRYVMDKFLYAVFEADHIKVVNKLGV